MKSTSGYDGLIESWEQRRDSFQEALKHTDKIAKAKYREPIDPFCHQAGKLFFETLNKIEFLIDIPKAYRITPCGEGFTTQKVECYREYWLCILAFFCRNDSKFIKYWNTRKYELPYEKGRVNWSWVKDEYELAQPYFIRNEKNLKSICEASIFLCDHIIELRKQQSFRIESDKQIIHYKNQTIRIGGINSWKLFQMLYEANGDTVIDKDIEEATNQPPNIAIGELKRHLRKLDADIIADVINKQQMVGYWLDLSAL